MIYTRYIHTAGSHMAKSAPSNSVRPILFNPRPHDTLTSISRDTLKLVAQTLGLTETQTMHFA